MSVLMDAIAGWLKSVLIDGIMGNLGGLFDNVNTQVGQIASQVGMPPAAFNPGVFSLIRTLSDTVVLPIAGLLLTFVMTWELIQLIIERNNLHELDTWIFFKWVFSATRSYTNTIPRVQTQWALRPSGAKNRGFSTCEKTTTDTLMGGMMG